MSLDKPPIPDELQQLKQQLEEFRNSNPPRSRLPESIWTAAAEAAQRHGLQPHIQDIADGLCGIEKAVAAGNAVIAGVCGTTRRYALRMYGGIGVQRQPDACCPERHTSGLGWPAERLARNRTMIQITPQMRVLVAVDAVDGRKGIDSLAQLCRHKLGADPFSGCMFLFRSRSATTLKILVYDGQGFWLAQKRLSQGRFRWWPEGTPPPYFRRYQAHLLLAAGNPDTPVAPVWKNVS